MKYKNKAVKLLKKSRRMIVSCGVCKQELIEYQKVGAGQLLKLFVDRIIQCEMPIGRSEKLLCPCCHTTIGYKIRLNNKLAYKMVKSYYNTKVL